MNQLVFALQKAHAAERAAFLAYDGHWRALKRRHPRRKAWRKIKSMQREELNRWKAGAA